MIAPRHEAEPAIRRESGSKPEPAISDAGVPGVGDGSGRRLGTVRGRLDPDDLEWDAEGAGEPLDVAAIACHDEIAAGDRSDSDTRIDHVASPCARARVTGRSGSCLVESLDSAALEETRQLSLWATSPRLAEHTRGQGGS